MVVITWIISLGLGVIPSSLDGKDFNFYENSHVCIGLPLVLTEMFLTEKIIQPHEYKDRCGRKVFDETMGIFNTKSLGVTNSLYFSVSWT